MTARNGRLCIQLVLLLGVIFQFILKYAPLLQPINIWQVHWVPSMTEEQPRLKGELITEDKTRTTSVSSLSSSGVSDEVSLLPEVAFAPGSNNGGTIDSPRVNRENQPLLGRMESDVTFNTFPGM
jgi:hypothetical protein